MPKWGQYFAKLIYFFRLGLCKGQVGVSLAPKQWVQNIAFKMRAQVVIKNNVTFFCWDVNVEDQNKLYVTELTKITSPILGI